MTELTKLGKYEIKRELGKGAMGVVYEGFDPYIERRVAIKTVLKSMLDNSEAQDMLNRFRREAQAAGRLQHPNIVSIYEYGDDQDVAFIAMEYVQGKELNDYFENNERFQINDVYRIMSELLDALEYSHNCGVVHRDIKPANIIITENNQVKVADFGIARIESSNLTTVGTVLGTPSYMSPEQFMGLAVDRRTDIYSAGVILYQFLAGEKPFSGSVVSIMHKVLNQEPVPPSAVNYSVAKGFDNVVRKAMARRLEDRYQTAKEFKEALKLELENPSSSSSGTVFTTNDYSDPNATVVIQSTVARDADMTMVAPAGRQSSLGSQSNSGSQLNDTASPKSKMPLIAGAAAVLVIVAGVVIWLFMRSPSEPAKSASSDVTVPVIQPRPPVSSSAEVNKVPEQIPVPVVQKPVELPPVQNTQQNTEIIKQPVREALPSKSIEAAPVKRKIEKTTPANTNQVTSSAAPDTRSIDDQFAEKAADCSPSDSVCQDILKSKLCHGKWSDNPPPGQSLCANSNRNGLFK